MMASDYDALRRHITETVEATTDHLVMSAYRQGTVVLSYCYRYSEAQTPLLPLLQRAYADMV